MKEVSLTILPPDEVTVTNESSEVMATVAEPSEITVIING